MGQVAGLKQILKYQNAELVEIEYELANLAIRFKDKETDLLIRKVETLLAINKTERLLEGEKK